MVQNVIERHGGQVRASNRPEGGALVEIELPAGTD
jgi:signal transduction histidine kinase